MYRNVGVNMYQYILSRVFNINLEKLWIFNAKGVGAIKALIWPKNFLKS